MNTIFEDIENLRRETYVKSITRACETDDVVGYIGNHIPLEIFFALNLMAIPVYGVDGDILRFSHEKNLCSIIDSTITYAKTDKCPLIHSSKLIVVENFCPVMTRENQKLIGKRIYIYDESRNLISKLNEIYGTGHIISEKLHSILEAMQEISSSICRLKYHSNLTGLQVYILEYYLNFLDLNERIKILNEISRQVEFSHEKVNFVPVHVQSGAGIYRQIDELYTGQNYRIFEDFCSKKIKYDFVYENCPFCEGTRTISYK